MTGINTDKVRAWIDGTATPTVPAAVPFDFAVGGEEEDGPVLYLVTGPDGVCHRVARLVNLDDPPRCAGCGEPWPCQSHLNANQQFRDHLTNAATPGPMAPIPEREPVAISALLMRRQTTDSPTPEESRTEFDALAGEVHRLRGLLRTAENTRNQLTDDNTRLFELVARTRKRLRGLMREGSTIGSVAGEVVGLAQEAAEDIDATIAHVAPTANTAELRERIEKTFEITDGFTPPLSDPLCHVLASKLTVLLNAADERGHLRAGLDVAERWLRTLAVNPHPGCPHGVWAREAQGDVAAALARNQPPAATP